MELNTLYEYLYDLGLHLQTEGSLDVFKAGFRPWPHVFKGGGRSKKFYSRVDANLDEDLARIGINSHRADKDSYTAILREVLNCFGIGIIDSLEYTMKNYIKQTGGELCNDNREEWENKAIAHMVSHNNYAERPFAVVKAFARMYPSLSLRNLSHLTHSLVNGTHRCADTFGRRNKGVPVTTRLAGIALTAHPALKSAVNKLCSVRRKSVGVVTLLVRAAQNMDKKAQVVHRKLSAKNKYNALIKQQATKAAKRDKAEMTAESNLCLDLKELAIQLKSRCNSKDSRLTFLKEQVNPYSFPYNHYIC
jgi:hypothetical protein